MITNFKIFENKENKKFWLIDNNDDMKIGLFKIGMDDDTIDLFYSNLYSTYNTDRHFLIAYDEKNNTWSYEKYYYTSLNSYYSNNDYDFMGEVEVDDTDRYNYNVRHDIKKYNL